jgi:hypothetical protein
MKRRVYFFPTLDPQKVYRLDYDDGEIRRQEFFTGLTVRRGVIRCAEQRICSTSNVHSIMEIDMETCIKLLNFAGNDGLHEEFHEPPFIYSRIDYKYCEINGW